MWFVTYTKSSLLWHYIPDALTWVLDEWKCHQSHISVTSECLPKVSKSALVHGAPDEHELCAAGLKDASTLVAAKGTAVPPALEDYHITQKCKRRQLVGCCFVKKLQYIVCPAPQMLNCASCTCCQHAHAEIVNAAVICLSAACLHRRVP
jgi:hypothetical protein